MKVDRLLERFAEAVNEQQAAAPVQVGDADLLTVIDLL
jgi:hypothetical protein